MGLDSSSLLALIEDNCYVDEHITFEKNNNISSQKQLRIIEGEISTINLEQNGRKVRKEEMQQWNIEKKVILE